MDKRPETIICDIDGTIFPHCGDITRQHLLDLKLLQGVKEKWLEWDRQGCHIILLTGRRESVRKETEAQLTKAGIFYDALVMNVGGGKRVLINDRKVDVSVETAVAITVNRNEGLINVLW